MIDNMLAEKMKKKHYLHMPPLCLYMYVHIIMLIKEYSTKHTLLW